jgi:branched-chain amino acid transport system permease protein
MLQALINGLMLGGLYACIAVGFSLVWGVLNIINMMHVSLIIFSGYVTYFIWYGTKLPPILLLLPVIIAMFIFGYLLQYIVINRVVKRPVLTTLTLTFGLDMILYNFMNSFFEATPRRISLNWGSFTIFDVILPIDRLVAMALAFILTFVLYLLLRTSKVGRAIVAVRMDRDAASLMGIQIPQIYAITFGLGAAMAGACGVLFAVAFPVTTNISGLLLGKAFVICVIGGLGSVPGALIGGLALGLLASFGSLWFGPQPAITIGFILMLILLMVRPTGLLGVKGYE